MQKMLHFKENNEVLSTQIFSSQSYSIDGYIHKWNKVTTILFLIACICMCMFMYIFEHMSAATFWGYKKVLETLELK